MNRSLLAAPAIAALLLTGLTGIATAQEVPDCSAEQQIVDTYEAGPPGTPSLLNLRAAVDAAVAADNEAGAVVDSDTTVAAKLALDARLGQLADVQAALDACLSAGDEPPTTDEPSTPQPTTTAPPATGSPLYENCAEARAFGAAPIAAGDPGYRAELDTDGDGTACEDSADDGFTPAPAGSTSGSSGTLFGGVDLSEGIETGA